MHPVFYEQRPELWPTVPLARQTPGCWGLVGHIPPTTYSLGLLEKPPVDVYGLVPRVRKGE